MKPNKGERPWGNWNILDEADGFKLKKIYVNPGQRLSYQSHEKRQEHWVIAKGKAKVTLNDKIFELGIGESIDIPIGAKHRIANESESILIFFELQTGTYFEEEDIKRYEDDYGRS